MSKLRNVLFGSDQNEIAFFKKIFGKYGQPGEDGGDVNIICNEIPSGNTRRADKLIVMNGRRKICR